MWKWIVTVVAVLWLVPAVVEAQRQRQEQRRAETEQSITFQEADRNRDQRLTRDEFYRVVSEAGLFGDWDTDADGLIEQDEFDSIGFADGFADFDGWDEDNNDFVDAAEFYEGVYEGFDVDETGHWDAAEWDHAGDAGWFDV